MAGPLPNEQLQTFKEVLQNQGPAAAAAKINAYLEEQDNIPLHIAVTGETGSGKSTFVNAFIGIDNKDENAAPTGCVETTMKVESYPHPQFPNVTLWDLPGIGTSNFPADKYLELVGFEKFDFFIIISADRFRENDVKLALKIQKMGKKFYFVRSKIDNSMREAKRSQRAFNIEDTLKKIRDDCIKGLENQDIRSPQVFLVSSFDLHLYDFHLLMETLERELPAHKRDVLLLAMPIVNLEIINKKKEALQSKIKYLAAASALGTTVPIPGLSLGADLTMLVDNAIVYKNTFGLDPKSLQSLADSAGVPLHDLRAEIKSPLALKEISSEVIFNMLKVSVFHVASLAAEEVSRFIPFFGFVAAAAISYASTYRALTTILNMLAEDAQRVFKKALDLDTPV
ncbi:interferon-inducible GTPase 5-like [Trematomus bernacchii]|uniref:interferon-inducible GTPase 5-like n=1 Tax=Trematomus bernacchii TaxID=40690 RepID=UPI00146BF31D|nr:interferon-inducible GTPase 5-like [Trematomus bernacchii]